MNSIAVGNGAGEWALRRLSNIFQKWEAGSEAVCSNCKSNGKSIVNSLLYILCVFQLAHLDLATVATLYHVWAF